MNLIIVESPTKAKTISRFVGDKYVVKSSYGHMRDLPKAELGIDTDNKFEPRYVIPTKSRKKVSELKKEVKNSDKIILATDEDREGEAIAWHLKHALNLEKENKQIERIVFHEITKDAIKNAMANPRDIDINLVNAQQARRILDRLVGYKLSPFLWKKIARGLSAGRVQSVAVRLIVERENEIRAFKPEEYWSIAATLGGKKEDKQLEAQLTKINGKAVPKLGIKTEKEAKDITSKLEKSDYKVLEVERKGSTKHPAPPFTTSTLQQDAARKFGFSAKQTMMLAQQLYEGIKLKEGQTGLITYMRTDSVNLSNEALNAAGAVINKEFGENYRHPQPRRFKTKSKSAQEAHEAIRPTDPRRLPKDVKSYLDPKQAKLYELIWNRFTASQMKEALFDNTVIDIEAKHSQKELFNLQARGTLMKFDGFLKVYPMQFEDKELPVVKEGENLDPEKITPTQHFTKPPARYNEASLIKTLEGYGIGRPSTYAPTLSTIQTRNYVQKNQQKYFEPTEVGELVNEVLTNNFPEIVDIEFTSHMEEDLDNIAAGKSEWVPIIDEFYGPFSARLEKKYEEVSKQDLVKEETDEICEKCQAHMIVKMGRHGKFAACPNFPECKFTKSLNKKSDQEPERLDDECENCGSHLVVRSGRRGKFAACPNYPNCKFTKPLPKKEEVK